MNGIGREIVQYSVLVAINFDSAKTARDQLKYTAVLSLLTQAQFIAQDDEAQARRLLNRAKEMAKLKSKAED